MSRSREARRIEPARRPHPGPSSIHRVTAAILRSAIPAPSPPSSTSKNSGKNHMNSVLVPLNPQRRKRTPWPSASRHREGWARDLRPAACRAPLRGDPSECAAVRAGSAHTGPLPSCPSPDPPLCRSPSLFDPGVPSFECGPLLGGVRFLLHLLPHFFTPHSLGFPGCPKETKLRPAFK